MYVGKDFSRKGGEYLLKAFNIVRKTIPDAELRIIGPELNKVPDGVKCLGFVSKYDDKSLSALLEEYRKARVFVVPSLYEPFGISFAEAMAHRVPCIGTNICAMPEVIKNGVTGFVVPPADEESLADRIIQLLSSEEMCVEMGDARVHECTRGFFVCQIVASCASFGRHYRAALISFIPINKCKKPLKILT